MHFKTVRITRFAGGLLATCLFLAQWAHAAPGDMPQVEVKDVRRVYDKGPHNAFTDLIRWQDRFWLTFRSCPDGHMVHPTSCIVVMSSADTRTWQEAHRFSVPLRDTRDPHFLAFKGQLFVYTGTWYSGETTLPSDQYDMNKHLGYAAWTADGTAWQGPRQLEGTYGHYVWRAATVGDKAYLCGRRNKDFAQVNGEGEIVESAMLESDDGLVWRYHSLFQEVSGDETAFTFDENGGMTAIGRRGRGPAQLIKSLPPYTEMTRSELTEYVGGPLVTRWGGRWVVGGRKSTDAGSRMVLYWLVDDKLIQFAQLPSDGDCSYPGFVELDPKHAVVSWYSTHETDAAGAKMTAVYVADVVIAE